MQALYPHCAHHRPNTHVTGRSREPWLAQGARHVLAAAQILDEDLPTHMESAPRHVCRRIPHGGPALGEPRLTWTWKDRISKVDRITHTHTHTYTHTPLLPLKTLICIFHQLNSLTHFWNFSCSVFGKLRYNLLSPIAHFSTCSLMPCFVLIIHVH